jgi:lipopolysaccharide biosynthesis glycosyltransferase
MTTAFCITTDAAYFLPALCAAKSIRMQSDGHDLDLFLLCEEGEEPPGLHSIDTRLNILTSNLDAISLGAPTAGFSRSVYRRLFLDRVLPDAVTRIVSLDADILVHAAGLSDLRDVNLRGHTLAGAYDMIFLKQFGGGALARRFAAHRLNLGLAPETPYFNNGVTIIDRRAWHDQQIGPAALHYVRTYPERCPYLEQDGLNAILKGSFAPLSPRYNFMGDFFRLNLETAWAPIVQHFVTQPKPWEINPWNERDDIPKRYDTLFGEIGMRPPPRPNLEILPPQLDVDWGLFRERLVHWLAQQDFIDGWRPPLRAVSAPEFANSAGQPSQPPPP